MKAIIFFVRQRKVKSAKHLIPTIFSLVLVKTNLLINNARSVKLVPQILVSEGIVIISSISFFIFLVLLIKRVKISFCRRYFPIFDGLRPLLDIWMDGQMRTLFQHDKNINICLLYTSPSPRDRQKSRMPSSA